MSSVEFNLSEFVRLARKIGSDTADVEVKTAVGGIPKDIVETVSAFSNHDGGTIVCGLSERDGFAPAEGFDAKRISEALSQACSDKMEPPVRADIRIEEFEGALVVVASIPEVAPFQKPCYVKARGPYEGSYYRAGEGDRKLSRYEVDRLTEERAQPTYDSRPVLDATVDEFDPELLSGFLARERAMSPRIFGTLPEEDALLALGVTKRDDAGIIRPTLAGLMALGRHPQGHFPRANVTFAAFRGDSKADPFDDGVRFLDSRTIIGPIPVMVAETLAAARRNMRIASYVIGGSRMDAPEYPEVAIREAVANALMHRDYSPEALGSQVQVNMFADRIEIISPGGLFGMVTVDNIGTYGASSSRNQFLSRILESSPYPEGYPERGFVVENKGSGFAQIQDSLRRRGMCPALPQDDLSLFCLTMWKDKSAEKSGPSAGPNRQATVNREWDVIVEEVRLSGSVTTSRAADALGVSTATAYRKLRHLVNQGFLKPSGGRGRAASYILA